VPTKPFFFKKKDRQPAGCAASFFPRRQTPSKQIDIQFFLHKGL
jgi:hypothetical protein